MTTGDNTGDSLPTQSYSPATTNANTGFGSYAEYVAKLKRWPVQSNKTLRKEELWLATFDGDGRCMEWNYCEPSKEDSLEAPKNLPAPDGRGIRPQTTVLSSQGFRQVLQTPDEKVAYRVVIVTAGFEAFASQTEDILGLGLDLGPDLFEFAQECVKVPYFDDALPRAWHKSFPALRIGHNALCILEARPEEASRTAIMFLGGGFLYEHSKSGLRISTSSVMYPSKGPSQVPEGLSNAANRPDFRYENTWLVQRFITSGIGSNDFFGKGNFLYVCLAVLLELQLSTAPLHVPHMSGDGLRSQVQLEYYGEPRGQKCWDGDEQIRALSADLSTTWTKLRMEVDAQRTTLRWITRFFRKYFDYSHQDIQAAFEDTMECLTFRLQDLEQSESQLRDHLAAEGTRKSIYMAKMSIRESKRVMLLTALAFIFLPVSLASSVYGMNVQQINSTGHSIRAFVITAVAMCASSVMLWAAFAAFQSYRVRLLSKQNSGENTGPTWYEELIMHGPLPVLQTLRRRAWRKWMGFRDLRNYGQG